MIFARLGRTIKFLPFLLLIQCTTPATAQSNLSCQYLPQLFDNYFAYHYTRQELSEPLQERTVENFLSSIDPAKTLLLQEDVDKLTGELKQVFASMRKDDCATLEGVPELLAKRASENEAFVREYMSEGFKLDTDIELMVNPDKREYAATEEEKHAFLRKMIHFQMSNYLLADMEEDEATEMLIRRYEVAANRLEKRTIDDMLVTYAESFARALDPHSAYMSQDRLKDFEIQMRLSLEGIGASLSSRNGFVIIQAIIPGGGAEKSEKLQPQDKIIAVAQDGEKPVSVIDMELSEVVKMIRGKKGTKVTLTIMRQAADTTETFDVTIVRDKIDIQNQAASIRYEERERGDRTLNIGVIELPSFYGGGNGEGRSSYADVRKLLLEAQEKNVDGIVLDLSRNGGGLLDEAVKISGLFIHKGAIVATQDTRGRVNVLRDEDAETTYAGPLTVMISPVSASASEILAGTLQAYGRALVVGGEHSYGKGSVQAVVHLPGDIGAMTVTTGLFFVPDGSTTQHTGVTSDISFPTVFQGIEVGERTMDHSLPPERIKPFRSRQANDPSNRWTLISSDQIEELAAKSQTRVEESEGFDRIRERIAENRESQGLIRIADLHNRAREREEARKEQEAREAKENAKAESAEQSENNAEAKQTDAAATTDKDAEESNAEVEEASVDSGPAVDEDGESMPTPQELEALMEPMLEESINIMADLVVLQQGEGDKKAETARKKD